MAEDLTFRVATEQDIERIVEIYHHDDLEKVRVSTRNADSETYLAAFREIESTNQNQIFVAELEGKIIGTAQLTIIPYLNMQAVKRAQISAMHVDQEYRGQGIGQKTMEFMIEKAQKQGCGIVQLITDKTRVRAHGFYERLGFVSSCEGMMKKLF